MKPSPVALSGVDNGVNSASRRHQTDLGDPGRDQEDEAPGPAEAGNLAAAAPRQ